MTQQDFIFGAGTGKTYADIKRMREIAEQFTKGANASPRTGMEGLHSIADALIARSNTRKADKAQEKLLAQIGPDSPIAFALMGIPQSAVPKYRYGTDFHPGGPAIVGEDGPELLMLPKGAKVQPNPMTLAYDDRQTGGFGMGDAATGAELDALPPEERQRVLEQINQGVPAPEALQPDWYDPIGPQGNLSTAGMVQTAQAEGETATDALPYGDAKLTEGQSKDINYYRRAFSANQELDKSEKALTQFTDSAAGYLGGVGRLFQDAEYQVADRAAKEFLAMVLRKDTGAAVTAEEFKMYAPMYIPEPGDKPEKLAAKRQARKEFLSGMEMGSGTAAPLYGKARDEISSMSNDDLLRALSGGN